MLCVKKLKTVQKRARNSKFTYIVLLRQKREDILKFANSVQNSLRNYKLLEISVFCQQRKENNNLTKYFYFLT